jgi:hypothetical protein
MNNNVRVKRAIENVLEKSLRHLEEAGELLGDTGDIDSKELDEAADAILVAIRKIWQYMGELDDVE